MHYVYGVFVGGLLFFFIYVWSIFFVPDAIASGKRG
jgi:hypothetical protein